MITYRKINDIQAQILINDVPVGWLEKPFRTGYKIEVLYHVIEIPASQERLISGLIDRIYKRIKSRENRRTLLLNEKKCKSGQ